MPPRALLLPGFALCLVLLGCTSTAPAEDSDGAPAWVGHFGIFDGPEGRCVEAVGSSAAVTDPSSRRTTALSNGRSQMALTVAAFTRLLADDFVASLRDSFADELIESGRFVDTVSRQVTDEVMHVSPSETAVQPERWTDPITKTTYVLMRLELETLVRVYREQMDRAYRRETTLGAFSASAAEYSDQLEAQLEQLREQSVAELTERFPSRSSRRNTSSSGL